MEDVGQNHQRVVMKIACNVRKLRLILFLIMSQIMPFAAADEASEHPSTDVAGQKAGEIRELTDLKIPFCWCPPGKFRMGSTETDPESKVTEPRAVEVELTHGFWIGRTEVTRQFYNAVEKDVKRPLPWQRRPWEGEVPVSPGKPASEVNWEYANLFCDDLNARERKENRLPAGWHYSLPTAAEWEYACRAGTTTRFSFGEDDGDLGRYGWTDNRGNDIHGDAPRDVAMKLPNQWGLFDMHGNVKECTLDVESSVLPGGVNPWSTIEEMKVQTKIVQKGGCWTSKNRNCRSAAVKTEYYQHAYPSDGFRIVLRQDTSLKR